MAVDLGDTVALGVDVADSDGAATDAATCVLTVTLPDGTTAAPSVSNPSTGRYESDYVPATPGRYGVRWVTTTPGTAWSDSFDVRPAFPAYIVSLADAKLHLNKTGDADDEELRTWLEVTTEVVDELAGRATARRTVTERRQLRCPADHLALTWSPVLSLTSVTSLDGATTWDVDDLDVDPTTGIVRVLTGPSLSGLVRFVYQAGSESIPARYTGAARIILRHLWETQRASSGRGGRGRGGAVSSEDMLLVAGYAIPRAAADLIGPRGPLVA